MNTNTQLFVFLFSLILLSSCSSPNESGDDNSSAQGISSSTMVTSGEKNLQNCDYNASENTLACSEQTYKTTTIGQQVWMAENLNFGSYLADDSSSSLYQNGTQKFCYDNDLLKCDTDGGLYQWHTAVGFIKECSFPAGNDRYINCNFHITPNIHQGICPNGWHIPSDNDWVELGRKLREEVSIFSDYHLAGKKMKSINSGFSEWDDPKHNDGNSSGFSALPSGQRYEEGGFYQYGQFTFFWATHQYDIYDLWHASVDLGEDAGHGVGFSRASGHSIRCLKDL